MNSAIMVGLAVVVAAALGGGWYWYDHSKQPAQQPAQEQGSMLQGNVQVNTSTGQ